MQIKKVLLIVLILFVLVLETQAQGCSQCKMLAAQSAEADSASFGSNINKGIIFLMAVPYILLFVFFRKKLALLFKKR